LVLLNSAQFASLFTLRFAAVIFGGHLVYQPQPYLPYVPDDSHAALEHFHACMSQRRSVRQFSADPVPQAMIEMLVATACSSPSGANKQPWRFVAVASPTLKAQIRAGAEKEERAFYATRAGEKWLDDLKDLGTDPSKPFLEVAPWLLVVFRLTQGDDGGQVYYSHESVGLACGLLLAAAQQAGLATLTHTPSPMRFLNRILDRPPHEKPFLLIPVGWPTDKTTIPGAASQRRPLDQSLLVRC